LDDDQATHVTSWDAAGNLAEILPGDFWPSLA
jgi:YD repeat-containing protein